MSQQIIFQTTEKIRIDDFLRRELPAKIADNQNPAQEISNSKIRRLFIAGAVFVNGRNVNRPAFELRGKSTVTVIYDKEKFFFEKQPDDIKFEVTEGTVLYETQNLIFINKPAFFPVEQTITGNRDNLHDAVVRYLWKRNPELRNPPYVGIMHRLDRETSGVILFTKSRTINKDIQKMFEQHDFKKIYEALVLENQKLFTGKKFTVEKFMGRISSKSQAGKWGQTPESKGGQYSKTIFTVGKKIKFKNRNCYEIECDLYTGRTHQIRVHLSEENFPILGDELYGGASAERIYLHAKELIIPGNIIPEIPEELSIKAPLPWN